MSDDIKYIVQEIIYLSRKGGDHPLKLFRYPFNTGAKTFYTPDRV